MATHTMKFCEVDTIKLYDDNEALNKKYMQLVMMKKKLKKEIQSLKVKSLPNISFASSSFFYKEEQTFEIKELKETLEEER